MLVLAKSTLKKDMLDDALRHRCDGVELQLLDELLNKGENYGQDSYKDIESAIDLDSFIDYPVRVVHTPVYGQNIETLVEHNFKLLDQVFHIANVYGEMESESIKVVVHSEMTMHQLMARSDAWKKVINGVGCLLFKYPYTELCIENVSPFSIDNNKLYLHNNFGFDNVVAVKELRRQLQTTRIGTVLDTCHALITNKYISALYNIINADGVDFEDYSLLNFFKENSDVISLVHISGIEENGLVKDNGVEIAIDTSSIDTLNQIVSYYQGLNYSCPVTIDTYDYRIFSSIKTLIEDIVKAEED